MTGERLRESYILEPGEGVLISDDIMAFTERCTEFLEDTNLDVGDIVISPAAGFPIPKAMKGTDGKLLKWEGVNPRMMWHPFFWLPEELALRYDIQEDEEGLETHAETDDEWALRVMATSAASGLFDVETGTWLNVLEWANLPQDEDTFTRIEAWLNGADDDEFDSIDLSGAISEEATDVGITMLGDTPIYIAAQWAATAALISEAVTEALEHENGVADYPVTELANYAFIGYSGNPGLPGQESGGAQDNIREVLLAHENGDADKTVVLNVLKNMSDTIYEAYSVFLEHVASLADEETAYEETSDSTPET